MVVGTVHRISFGEQEIAPVVRGGSLLDMEDINACFTPHLGVVGARLCIPTVIILLIVAGHAFHYLTVTLRYLLPDCRHS